MKVKLYVVNTEKRLMDRTSLELWSRLFTVALKGRL